MRGIRAIRSGAEPSARTSRSMTIRRRWLLAAAVMLAAGGSLAFRDATTSGAAAAKDVGLPIAQLRQRAEQMVSSLGDSDVRVPNRGVSNAGLMPRAPSGLRGIGPIIRLRLIVRPARVPGPQVRQPGAPAGSRRASRSSAGHRAGDEFAPTRAPLPGCDGGWRGLPARARRLHSSPGVDVPRRAAVSPAVCLSATPTGSRS